MKPVTKKPKKKTETQIAIKFVTVEYLKPVNIGLLENEAQKNTKITVKYKTNENKRFRMIRRLFNLPYGWFGFSFIFFGQFGFHEA